MERALEEFIARANAVAPPVPAAPDTTVLDSATTGRFAASDRTEIVERPLPYTPPARRLTWILVALAFAAGGGAVVLAVRLVSPRPAAPTISIVPPVVVIPQPTVEKLPETPAGPGAEEPKPTSAAGPVAEPQPTQPAQPAPPKKRVAKKAEKDPKAPSGLVDPFAE